jgi:hypothetical protein
MRHPASISGMKAGPILDVCPNCGAPLELDEDERCRWCHARIQLEPAASNFAAFPDDQASLVPDDVDDQAVAPFIYLTLATLGPLLDSESAVQEFARKEPGTHRTIRALSTAVGDAGVRVRDAGLLKDGFDENLKVYTPQEIWTFDLAIDLIAMLGALDGLSRGARAQIVDSLRSLDWSVHSHTWKKELKKAEPGPEAFRELRAKIPRHTPKPAR